MLIAQRENRENDVLTGATRARIGPPALLDQAKRTKLPIAPQPLVPRLPRDAELLAKCREIAAFLRRSLHELKFQTHGALLFPGHPSFERGCSCRSAPSTPRPRAHREARDRPSRGARLRGD